MELSRQFSTENLINILNQQLPEGFSILECQQLYWKTPSPSASIEKLIYKIVLPESFPELAARIRKFLASESVLFTRMKKNRPLEVDLRPDVIDIELKNDCLELTLKKGSPFGILAWLLNIEEPATRQLDVRKSAVILHGEANE